MNRNTELHFKNTPQIDIKRSKFEMSHSNKTTFNAGDIIPIDVDPDRLPGDTVQMDMAELIRMATPIYPIMDNLYMDLYWFFVPHRLVWEHWQEFWGENDDPWTQETEYEIPQLLAPTDGADINGWDEGSIADYFGIPTKVSGISVNALPFRAYAKIYNDWFRDENLKKNCHIYKDETTRMGKRADETTDYVLDTELGGKPAKAAKMHDYFTSALPQPQKGEPVTVPLGGLAPVTAQDQTIEFNIPSIHVNTRDISIIDPTHTETLKWYTPTNLQAMESRTLHIEPKNIAPQQTTNEGWTYTSNVSPGNKKDTFTYPTNLWTEEEATTANYIPNGFFADLNRATSATINSLRTAFAIQKYFENAGLHGTRYIEYIRSVFGVTSSDARFQRAEYIGGQRVPINIDQVLQTSATDITSPQGNTAGFSCTINRDSMFTKSFEEHGTLMCLAVIRTEHTYQQGLNKKWTRKKWTDFYNPFFANLGEQAILNENIYATGEAEDKEAFGYQEAWAEYRYKENYVTGYMRSNATGSLDVWHFADDYETTPRLSSEWIDEPYENIDRTIAVTSAQAHQFIADFYFKCYYTRPMPVYSIPGLIDHV